jgi:4-hydroxy-tetrahydrodipicolinate synthase
MAEREGVDGVSVITPYFVNPSQQEIYDHYRRILARRPLQQPGHLWRCQN